MATGKLSITERPLGVVEERPLDVLYQYWRDIAAGRPFVPNSELRPERFAAALANIAIVERVGAPRPGLRIRVCGSDLENKDFGLARGAFLEDVRPPWYRDHLVATVTDAMSRGEPIYQRVTADIDDHRFSFTRLMLPLTSTGDECDMLMVAAVRPSDSIVNVMRARLTLA